MIVQSQQGVTLVGAGRFSAAALAEALALAPLLVAADGGADGALRAGHMPEAVIGDLDSLTARARSLIPPGRIHLISEQETTDFDKALRSVAAPFVLGLGFSGGRLDHTLSAMNVLVRHAGRRCLLVSARDVTFHLPREIRLALPVGTRLSLFPMAPLRGESEGLRWPLGGLALAPDGMTATSNLTSAPEVRLAPGGPGLLAILPRAHLDAALAGLLAAG